MIEIRRIDASFNRWDELLVLILASFSYMDGVIDPPASAHRLTHDSLARKAADEIAFVVFDGAELVGCAFLRPEADTLYVASWLWLHPIRARASAAPCLTWRKARRAIWTCRCCAWKQGLSSTLPCDFRQLGLSQDGGTIPSRLHPDHLHRDAQGSRLTVSPGPEAPGSAGGGHRKRSGC